MGYYKRIIKGENSPKKWELCLWWACRLVLISALIHALFISKADDRKLMALQVVGNLIGMFAWEILMLFPSNNLVRNLPAYIQDVSSIGLLTASFGGAYLNLYYSMPVLDIVMHTVGGVLCTILGYEIFCAMQIRDKTVNSVAIIAFAAFCFFFVAGNVWELFEFIADQLNPSIGDAQHWSLQLAIEADLKDGIGMPNFIDARDDMRYAIIDTMEDMICNTVGGFAGWIILKVFPYHHKGNNDLNKRFTKEVANI